MAPMGNYLTNFKQS